MEGQKTQRDSHFKGGIPLGLSATSEVSKGLEQLLRRAVFDSRVATRAEALELKRVGALKRKDLETLYGLPCGWAKTLGGVSPDGGIWLNSEGIPVMSAEAKKQGEKGNAIERQAKNQLVLTSLNPKLLNLVFCRGEGFFGLNSAQTIMATLWMANNKLSDEDQPSPLTNDVDSIWNTHRGNSMRLYRFAEEDFDTMVYEPMVEALLKGFEAL